MKGFRFNRIFENKYGLYISTFWELFITLLMLWLTRFVFVVYNHTLCGGPDFGETMRLAIHGFRYDLSAVLYFNILFIAMRLLPFKFVYRTGWIKTTNWVYGISNSVMLAINIGDIPYYAFTGTRLRWVNILNIATDTGIGKIILQYSMQYWWACLAGIAFIALTLWLAFLLSPRPQKHLPNSYLRIVIFFIAGLLCFAGMRGRVGKGNPLGIADAAFVVQSPPEINVVLNSPFTILRSLNVKKSNAEPLLEFFSDEELGKIRNSVRKGHGPLKKRNYMIIMIESGGAEWIDALSIEGPHKTMPFLDSLTRVSTVVDNVMACGRSSVGGTTAVLGGFPAFEPMHFMLSPYNQNTFDSPARLLKERGWSTIFFYGCAHGSFNIDQTAYASGFKTIVDLESYGVNKDYDGTWGVYDYPMAERVIKDLATIPQPFLATWFTITSHSPFSLPEGWDISKYNNKELGAEQVLEYTDQAIAHFFEMAKRQPWYTNTTFFITGDHGNREFPGTAFDGDYVRNRIPLLIYTPDGSMEAKRITDRVISQHDIPRTLLTIAGYDKNYVSLGEDALGECFPGYGIVRTDGGRYFVVSTETGIYLTPDLKKIEQVYDIKKDPELQNPLTNYNESRVRAMHRWAQAFMQDYTTRLNRNRLSLPISRK